MKNQKVTRTNWGAKAVIACAAAGWICWSGGNFCQAQTSPANPPTLSPDLQEVVKLSQQQMSDDVIINYIRNSGKIYTLSPEDLINLKNQGVSQAVLVALEQTAPSAAPNPAPAAPPAVPPAPAQVQAVPPPAPTLPPQPGPAPAPVVASAPEPEAAPAVDDNFAYFHDQLAPFGEWVQVAGYGWCWRPTQAIALNPDWRPYYDMGQWVYTDNGWFWQSDYTWGDIPFHYGNWIIDPVYGWIWVPGYTWGPAWVFWREADADGCIGWAPLPPGAVFVDGGWLYRGRHYGVDFDFGLGADFFVFVGFDHFHDSFLRMRGHEYAFNVPRERIRGFYGRSVLRNDFRRDEHGRLVNDGLGRDRVEQLTHHQETVAHFEERNPVGDRDNLRGQPTPGHPSAEPAGKVFRPPAQRQGPGQGQEQGQRRQ